jgi:hypothetical protein
MPVGQSPVSPLIPVVYRKILELMGMSVLGENPKTSPGSPLILVVYGRILQLINHLIPWRWLWARDRHKRHMTHGEVREDI